jgi:hypothetical protein
MEEPLHPTPHQKMPYMHVADAEKGTKTQLHEKSSVLWTSDIQKLAKLGPPTPANTLRGILHKGKVSVRRNAKELRRVPIQKYLTTTD